MQGSGTPISPLLLARQHVHVQAIERPFSYAIVDEADSVLIDDCLNPLLMSQPTEDDPRELGQRSKLAQQVERRSDTVPRGLCLWSGVFLMHDQSSLVNIGRGFKVHERISLSQVIDSCAEDGQFLLWEQKANPESGAIEVKGHYVIDTHLQRVSLTHVGMKVVLQRLGEPPGQLT